MRYLKLKPDDRMYMLLFLLCICKYVLYGFSYFPVLDDFIQYDGYRMYNDLSYVYFGIGTIATRPLASVLDPLLWGAMPKSVSFFIITMLHFFSCVLFYKSAQKLDVKMTPVFGIVYLLFPLGAESTYWLSASTRIVCGLFTASAGFYFLCSFIKSGKNGKKRELFAFWLLSFLSCGFYEAALAFSAAGSFILMLYMRKKIKKKWIFIIPFVNCAFLSGIYAALSGVGKMGSRADGFKAAELFKAEKFTDFFSQIGEIFSKGFYLLTKSSFGEGISLLLSGRAFGAFVILCILLLSCAFLYKSQKGEGKTAAPLIFSIIMFFVPLLVNFLPDEMWLTFRSFGFSLFALALFADRLICLAKSSFFTGAVSVFLAILFAVGSVGEYSFYKEVSEQDVRLSTKIAAVLEEDVLSGEKEVVVVMEKFPESRALFYKDHVKSVFYEDWSLTGAVRSAAGNIKIKKVTPVKYGEESNKENKQIIYTDENFDVKGEKHIG